MMKKNIMERIRAGERIDGADWLTLAREASLHELGFLAHGVRLRLHPDPLVTYVIDRNINYTDICISGCTFCRRSEESCCPTSGSTICRRS